MRTRSAYWRRGVLVWPFTPDEDRIIVQRRVAGEGPAAIARQLADRCGRQRSAATVSMRLKALAKREEM